MITLQTICILYTVISWYRLYKIKETDIFNHTPTLGRVILVFTTGITIVAIIILIVTYCP